MERSWWNDVFDRVEIKDAKVNDYLNRLEDRYKEFLILNAATLNEYNAAEIRDKVLGQERSKKKVVTLLNFVTNHYEGTELLLQLFDKGDMKLIYPGGIMIQFTNSNN